MHFVKLVLLSLLLAAAQASASTVTIDMEGIAPAGDLTEEINVSHYASGYELFINHGHFIDSAWSDVGSTRADNGTDYLGIDSLEPAILSQVGGGAFTIYSFDATDVFTDFEFIPNLVFEVTGTLAGGGSLFASFTSDTDIAFETFVFGSEWTNLSSVSFIGNTHGAYDNIVVSSSLVVPIPAAVWLFISGLFMLFGVGKNSKRPAS